MRFASRLALVLAALAGAARGAEAPADLVLRGGDVLTQDPAHPHARAVAVRAGFIVALDDVDALIGPHTRVIELHGRAVVPSLTDAHGHLAGLGFAAAEVDLRGPSGRPSAAPKRPAAAPPSRGDWILGRGWDQNRFADGKFPTHAALDCTPAPGGARARRRPRPVGQRRRDAHGARRSRATPDPPGGKILRDERGEPTGVFVDNAMSLVDARGAGADRRRD